MLHSLEGDEIECMVCLDFPTTNNEAEYEALVAGLGLVKSQGPQVWLCTTILRWS